jgi:hypothetical protein
MQAANRTVSHATGHDTSQWHGVRARNAIERLQRFERRIMTHAKRAAEGKIEGEGGQAGLGGVGWVGAWPQ